ncbi:hypothetical protein CAP35_06365 [Chitinophagaceae bacterium IBVUCB1]|nr:hypothetical protein CAP35_06365 [Chitinophagaceae bacterium IBVUCB1]
MNLPFFIARRYLLRRKGAFSSFIIRLAIVATTISVAAMIMAIAIVTGFKYEVREKLFSFWGHVQIQPHSMNTSSVIAPQPISRDVVLEKKVLNEPHVASINAFAARPAIIHAANAMEGVQLKGVDANYKLPESIDIQGRLIDYSDTAYAREIMLSAGMASRLDVQAGDMLELYFIEPGSVFPRIRKVKIAGTYHTGMEEIDRTYAICDLRLLQRINGWGADKINGYQLALDDDTYADTVANRIYYNHLQPPLTTYTMMDIFPNLFDWLHLQDVNTRVVIGIMAIVAIINLAAALLILIVEQVRMVGILKAQGMPTGQLQRVFLYHAAIISGIGIIAGNILALGICWLQLKTGFLKLTEASYSLKYVPVKLYWWQPLVIDAATILLCILCMWLPSLYIRRIQPARVLQFK